MARRITGPQARQVAQAAAKKWGLKVGPYANWRHGGTKYDISWSLDETSPYSDRGITFSLHAADETGLIWATEMDSELRGDSWEGHVTTKAELTEFVNGVVKESFESEWLRQDNPRGKELGLWGHHRRSGLWKRLRGVTAETKTQWLHEFRKGESDVYDEFKVSANKPKSKARAPGTRKNPKSSKRVSNVRSLVAKALK